jgi:hypothetical protein
MPTQMDDDRRNLPGILGNLCPVVMSYWDSSLSMTDPLLPSYHSTSTSCTT